MPLRKETPRALNGKLFNFVNREEYWTYNSCIDYGAETIQELFDRVFSFLDGLKVADHKDILVVAHSGVSKAFYAYFNGIPKDKKFLDLGLDNCEVKKICTITT